MHANALTIEATSAPIRDRNLLWLLYSAWQSDSRGTVVQLRSVHLGFLLRRFLRRFARLLARILQLFFPGTLN